MENYQESENYLSNTNIENNVSAYGSQFDYSILPKGCLIIGILLNLTGVAMQCFVIMYERFNMDPMKRGLINQLITTYMLYAMSMSILAVIRWLSVLLFPPWPLSFNQVFGWLRFSSHIGCLLSMAEIIFFLYWSKMWLKHVPSYNHNFLGIWLNVANFFHALYFGGLQAYCQSQWAKDEDGYTGPRLKIVAIISFAIVFLCIVYVVHKVVDWVKECAKKLKKNIKISPILKQVEEETKLTDRKESGNSEMSLRRNKGEPKSVFLERLQKYNHQNELTNTKTMFAVPIGPQETSVSNSTTHNQNQSVQSQSLTLMLNTMKFNPDLLNWPIILSVFILVLIHILLFSVIEVRPLFGILYHSSQTFYIPLLFCTFNQRLRFYIWSHFSKN